MDQNSPQKESVLMVHDPVAIGRNVLQLEADAIHRLRQQLDGTFQRAVELILSRKGRALVLGVGKSGHIGRKIAATLASTGQPSFFIHAAEAIHGDLGMVTADDICLMISHSGNTSELLEILPAVKRQGLPVITITANPRSKLAMYSDVVLNTHVSDEACPFNLAPTNSTTVTLALGDALAICLLKMKGFREEQFAMFHPGGMLGKKLLTKVSDLMITESLPLNRENDSFREALAVMTRGRQGVTIIVDNGGACIGILTDGDIRRAFEKYDHVSAIELNAIYTRNPKTIRCDALATEALKTMQDRKITSLVAVDGDRKVQGLIHIHHLLEKGFV